MVITRSMTAAAKREVGDVDRRWRRHRGRCKWRDLLFGGLNDAMFGVISDLLRRPFTLWRFVEIVAPGFAADGGAVKHVVFSVGLCLLTSPFAFAFGAHGATPALATGLVRASLQEEADYGKRCQECCSSNQLLRHNKVSLSLQTGRGALCRLSGSVQGQYLRHTGVYRTVKPEPVQLVTSRPCRYSLSAAIL